MTNNKITLGCERVRSVFRNPITVHLHNDEFPSCSTGAPNKSAGTKAKLSTLSHLSQMSDMSVLSAHSKSIYIDPNWTAEQLCLFEERAAIFEYDGGMVRSVAEYYARKIVDQNR